MLLWSVEEQSSPRLCFLPKSRACPCCWRARHCPGPGILIGVQWGLQHLLVTLGPLLKGCERVPGFVLALEGW